MIMRSIGFKLGLGILAIASGVSAGSTSGSTVTHISATETRGVVRDVRFSANSVEFLGCSVRSNGLVACFAKDAAGTYRSCSTTAAGFATAAAGIGPNSFLTITYNAAGTCTLVDAYNTSIYLD